MYGDDPDQTPAPNLRRQQEEQVEVWMKRISAAEPVKKEWETFFRIEDCYQYWKGRQRKVETDRNGDRLAQHNKVHPDVAEDLPSLYFYAPTGRVIAAPAQADTPLETVSRKAQLLQDTGMYLVKAKEVGFLENTQIALKESRWAVGCVEVGYSPDFMDNPYAKRPPLKEKEDTKVDEQEPLGVDELGLNVDPNSDTPSLEAEIKRLRQMLRGETFYVRHIPANHLLISPSNKAMLWENDWVGYWEDYPLEDIKRSPAYENTEDLKASGGLEEKIADGSVDRVRLYRIWDLRSRVKRVFALGHKMPLMTLPFERCSLFFYREDIDPYQFFPVPPVYLKLDSQDGYNDSAEYMRKMRVTTVPRYTYDADAIDEDQADKFLSRDFNIMIPRKANTHQVIEPVNQPSTAAAAIQTLSLSDKEFVQAGSASGNPLDPPSQTATRVVVANARVSAQENFNRDKVAKWLAEIIQELIMLAVENMNIAKFVAINVDLDSPAAMNAAAEVTKTYQEIHAEKLRSAVTGINWTVEVEADSLSPVAETEKGMKMVQMINFLSEPRVSMLVSKAPNFLKRLLSLAGFKSGEDLRAVKEALAAVVEMNMQMMMMGKEIPGISPKTGEPASPPIAAPKAPGMPPIHMPTPPGIPGA